MLNCTIVADSSTIVGTADVKLCIMHTLTDTSVEMKRQQLFFARIPALVAAQLDSSVLPLYKPVRLLHTSFS
jgi:hypothetical protein